MRKRSWILFAILVAAALPFTTAPQNIQVPHSDNFQLCLEGFTACNSQALTPREQQAVTQLNSDRNFEDCLNGYIDCDTAKLDAEQKNKVARALRDQNLQNCLAGYRD